MQTAKHILAALILACTFLPGTALAYCFAPSPPGAPATYSKPHKPDTPYCVDTYTNTHRCDDWEINAYNRAMDQYNSDAENYIRQLTDYENAAIRFAEQSTDYAECEIRSLE